MRETVNTRVYRSAKKVVTSGAFIPGTRIDASQLAFQVKASVTPVRLALNRMVGERLVELHTNDGYHMPRITEPDLRDRYDWNLHLAHTGLRLRQSSFSDTSTPDEIRNLLTHDPIEATEAFFLRIAHLADNLELTAAVEGCNDRMRAVRYLKNGMIADREGELKHLIGQFEQGDFGGLAKSLIIYHKRRKNSVAWLVRRLHELK